MKILPINKENKSVTFQQQAMECADFDYFSDPVTIYSGRQAIEDGFLMDVGERAREAGFIWPVAITTQLLEDIQNIPASKRFQDFEGRLWDVLSMLSFRIRIRKQKGLEPETRAHYRIIMHVGRKTYYDLTATVTFYEANPVQPMIVIGKYGK